MTPHRVLLYAALLVLAPPPAARAAPTAAVLPAEVAFEDGSRRDEAEAAVDLIAARATDAARWVDRRDVDRRAAELGLDRLAGGAGLAAGRGLGADLLVLPAARRDGDSWSLRLSVVDPVTADVLAEVDGTFAPGDAPAWADRLDAALDDAAAAQGDLRASTTLAPLFLANATGTERLDAFGDRVVAALRDADQPGDGVRVLRFPAVPAAAGERRLALSGLAGDPGRWRELADRWVWGEYREVDWQGTPFDQVRVEAAVVVWDGTHEPVVVERAGTAGDLDALAADLASAVLDAARRDAPAGEPMPPEAMAERLLAQATALQEQNVGGNWGASAAWLARWRREIALLELASFFDPSDPRPALQHVLSRYRDDVTVPLGPNGGRAVVVSGEDPRLFALRRARAWGDFGRRFGLGGGWPTFWPFQRGVTDNRAPVNAVAHAFLDSAREVRRSLPGGRSRGMREDPALGWPMSLAEAIALAEEWDGEIARRQAELADAADSLAAGEGAMDAGAQEAAWWVVRLIDESHPQAARRLIDRLAAVADAEGRRTIGQHRRGTITGVGERTGDPAWAAALLDGLPTPPEPPGPRARREPAPRRPSDLPKLPVLEPAGDGPDLDDADVTRVTALAAEGDAWLAAVFRGGLGGSPTLWSGGEADVPLVDVAAMARRDGVAWLAGRTDGVVRIDLRTGETRHFGLDTGLPTLTLAAVAVDPAGVPTVASGPDVAPTVATLGPDGQWSARPVETFAADDRPSPTPGVVAVGDAAIVVAGDHFGVLPFASLYGRDADRWVDLRANLVEHLTAGGFDFRKIEFGLDRFNARDALALPESIGGGFALIHDFGVTRVTDAGEVLDTRPFGLDRHFTAYGDALLSADGRRLWVSGAVHRGGGACLIEVDLADADAPPVFLDLPRSLGEPGALAQDGDALLVAGTPVKPPLVFRFPLRGGSLVP